MLKPVGTKMSPCPAAWDHSNQWSTQTSKQRVLKPCASGCDRGRPGRLQGQRAESRWLAQKGRVREEQTLC